MQKKAFHSPVRAKGKIFRHVRHKIKEKVSAKINSVCLYLKLCGDDSGQMTADRFC